MKNEHIVELVRRHLNGETVPELAKAFETTENAIRYNLTHIFKKRRSGRRIEPDTCVYPNLAKWLMDNDYSGAWLADRIGVSKQQMSYYLHGYTNCPVRRQEQISAVIGIDRSWLFAD